MTELRAAGGCRATGRCAAVFAPSPEHELPAHAWAALTEALRQGQPVATA